MGAARDDLGIDGLPALSGRCHEAAIRQRFTAFADRKRKALTTAIEPDEELADVDAELEPAVADARSPQELAVILAGVDATFPRVADSPPRRPNNTAITRT